MGLFSSKTVTTVGTQVSRVIEDSTVPNSLANGIAKNLFEQDDQMISYVMDELVTSIGLRATQMLQYGRKHYDFGLPKSTIKTSAAGRIATEEAVQALHGAQVATLYYHFGPYNHLHFGWQQLVDVHGYDSTTNQIASLTQAKGIPVYLADLQVVVTDATLQELENGSMDQWGTAANTGWVPGKPLIDLTKVAKPTPFAVDPAAGADYVRADYVWETEEIVDSGEKDVKGDPIMVPRKVLHRDSLRITVSGLDPDADYHQISYLLSNKRHFWTYRAGSGANPAIDSVFDTAYAAGGTFFPITYFRYAKTSAVKDENSSWYKQSAKMMDVIGLDFEAVATAIDQNPDIADVEQAMMMMAVPANTTNELEQRYLFDFFSGLYQAAQSSVGTVTEEMPFFPKVAQTVRSEGSQATSIVIQDARFKMALSFQQIVRRRRGGTIGKVGSHTSGRDRSVLSEDVPVVGGGTSSWDTKSDVHWYRRQITETLYEELVVYGLKMTYWVFENYTTVGDEDDKILLIPVDEAITRNYAIPDKEALYARSMHYIFNSRVVTKLKWYQQGWFATLLTVAAIFVAVLTMQPEVYALAANIVTIVAVSSTVALVIAAALLLLEKLIIGVAIKYFVKKIGVKAALIAAIALAVAGMYQQFSANAPGLAPNARMLLDASSTLSKAGATQAQRDMQDLAKDWKDFDTYVKEKTRLLEETQDLLDTGVHLSPLVIFGESPNDFYQRTVHSGNIGVLAFDAVSSYVDMALQLPKLNDTLGGSV